MVKITEIEITVVNSKPEDPDRKLILKRSAEKLWYVENEMGLHPSLVDLANRIQKAISEWSS